MATIQPGRLFGGHPAPRFLALAIGSLISVGLFAPRAFPLLTGSFYDRGLLAFVHLNTLGVIAAAMVAATFQVVPCALGVPLRVGRAGSLMFWLHLGGLLVFLLGFHQNWHPVLATGGLLLAAGLGLYVVIVGRALRQAAAPGVTGWHIAVSLVGLSAGVLLGFLLAGSKGTWFLGDVTLQVLSAHAVLMLAGWVLIMLNGVAYHMVPMLSGSAQKPWRVVAWIELALLAAGAWLAAGSLLFSAGRPWVLVGMILIVLGEALFVAQMLRFYLPKLRAAPGSQDLFVVIASMSGLSASGLVAAGLSGGEPLVSRYWLAAGWLAIGGVALSAIQGLAPTIGSEVTGLPLNLEHAWQRGIAAAGWTAWMASLLLITWAILGGDRALARFAGFAALAGIGCFGFNVLTGFLRAALPAIPRLSAHLPRVR
jgi:hypothetical protein